MAPVSAKNSYGGVTRDFPFTLRHPRDFTLPTSRRGTLYLASYLEYAVMVSCLRELHYSTVCMVHCWVLARVMLPPRKKKTFRVAKQASGMASQHFGVRLSLGRSHEPSRRSQNRPSAGEVSAGGHGSGSIKGKGGRRVEKKGLEARRGLGIRVLRGGLYLYYA